MVLLFLTAVLRTIIQPPRETKQDKEGDNGMTTTLNQRVLINTVIKIINCRIYVFIFIVIGLLLFWL